MAPSISSGSGTALTGSNITLLGSGFDTKPRSTPYAYCDFQSGSLNTASGLSFLNVLTTTQNNAFATDLTNKRWGNGGLAKAVWPRDGTGSGRSAVLGVNFTTTAHGKKFIVSGWRNYQNGDTSGNWKWWRVWPTSGEGTYPDGYVGDSDISDVGNRLWYLEDGTPVNGVTRVYTGYPVPGPTWRMEEFMIQMNSATGATDGQLILQVNNVDQINTNTAQTDYPARPNLLSLFEMEDTKASADPGASMQAYKSDFYADDSWNRVYIGNAATLSACTHKELQPFSSWSSTAITINTRLGSFTSTTGLYLFVVDNSNNASSGFSLASLGGGGAPAPTVYSLSPNAGPLAGSTAISITGANFASPSGVSIGGNAATSVVGVNSTTITAVTPAHGAGAVSVVVTNGDAQTGTLPNGFTYQAAPTVSSVAPNGGPLAGGTSITITGVGFTSTVNDVTIGGTSCTAISRINSTTITCVTPAKTAAAYNVVVTNSDGQTGTLSSGYTYRAAPTVTSATPNHGIAPGGVSVTVAGTGFVSGATIKFGTFSATSVVFGSSTSLICNTPALSAGSYAVTVTNPDTQSGTHSNAYTSDPAPVVSSISPSFGPTAGATAFTITGTGFVTGATITVGSSAATSVAFVNSTSLTGVTPAHAAGTADVIVTNPDTQTGILAAGFTYVGPPTITAVSPSSGTILGLTPITVTGTGFSSSISGLTIGGTTCTSIVRVNATTITALTPAKSAATYNVVVTNSDTQTGTLVSGYTYSASAPTVTSINVLAGPLGGGTAVTLTGTGFTSTINDVTFDGISATSIVRVSSTSITCVTPAHGVGQVNIVVTNNDASTGTLTNGFTYQPAPSSISVSPSSGATTGGLAVTVNGLNFTATINSVTFGGSAATSVVRVSTTQITCHTPAHAAGAVTVAVINNDGQVGSQPAAFTYSGILAPTITSISPTSSSTTGNITATITGTGFLSGATVHFGGTSATGVVVSSSTQIVCTVPAHSSNTVSVTVTNTDSQVGTLTNGFAYRSRYREAIRNEFIRFFNLFH